MDPAHKEPFKNSGVNMQKARTAVDPDTFKGSYLKGDGSIGLIGLAVMGQNLALNFADHGFQVSVFNRTFSKTEHFLESHPHNNLKGYETLEKFCRSIEERGQGRKRILLMVKAGEAVDQQIEALLPFLKKGDLLIDAGNSHSDDTQKRMEYLQEKGIYFVGAGVSGGEEGARHGPSIMVGACPSLHEELLQLLMPIAARDFSGGKCCSCLGSGGAGHFVKTVHNGIEYGDMQLIAETFDLLRRGIGLELDTIAEIFSSWNEGVLGGYLNEITADILKHRTDGNPTIDSILDVAGHKGTGRWSCEAALSEGRSLSLVYEALATRMLSSQVNLRHQLSSTLPSNKDMPIQQRYSLLGVSSLEELSSALEKALWSCRLISYTQGFDLIKSYYDRRNEPFDGAEIARVWSGGCIIRSKLLEEIAAAFKSESVTHLLQAKSLREKLSQSIDDWKKVTSGLIHLGIPAGAYCSALNYYQSMSSSRLPTYLIQAQRDYFGAHTYERIDRERGESFHTQWSQPSKQLKLEQV